MSLPSALAEAALERGDYGQCLELLAVHLHLQILLLDQWLEPDLWDLVQWEHLQELLIQLQECQVVMSLYLVNLYILEKVLKQ